VVEEDGTVIRVTLMKCSPVLTLRMGTTKITLLEGERCEAEGEEQIKIAPTGTMKSSEVSLPSIW
jgi:hypothetical protein